MADVIVNFYCNSFCGLRIANRQNLMCILIISMGWALQLVAWIINISRTKSIIISGPFDTHINLL